MHHIRADVLGTSEVFLQFEDRLGQLAKADRPVLVLGERGTGKELAVQRLHYRSARWEKPLVTVLCPALSPTLLEAELFGHEAGAFTGARGRRIGYLERAHGGTLFLDEVADMPLAVQDKLLRVIEYGEFERVGGTAVVRVDVRVVAATNGDLPRLAQEGRFRADLLDRLAFDVLHVPPLRQRGEDKLLLARHFASGMAAELGLLDATAASSQEVAPAASSQEVATAASSQDKVPAHDFSPFFGVQALTILETYPWPGNIRELKNVVERSVARRQSMRLESLDVDPFVSPYGSDSNLEDPQGPSTIDKPSAGPACVVKHPRSDKNGHIGEFSLEFGPYLPDNFRLHDEILALESAALAVALEQAKYRQTVAAGLLGLSYHQFRALLKKCGKAYDK